MLVVDVHKLLICVVRKGEGGECVAFHEIYVEVIGSTCRLHFRFFFFLRGVEVGYQSRPIKQVWGCRVEDPELAEIGDQAAALSAELADAGQELKLWPGQSPHVAPASGAKTPGGLIRIPSNAGPVPSPVNLTSLTRSFIQHSA